MTLREYLFRNNISCEDFALLVDCSRNYISRIKNDQYMPGRKIAKIIVEKTNGQVGWNDLGFVNEPLSPLQMKKLAKKNYESSKDVDF